MSFIDNSEMIGFDGKQRAVADHFSEKDFVTDNGRQFVKHGPMLREVKKIFGIRFKTVNVIQAPSRTNGMIAAVQVSFGLGKDSERYGEWSATADCGPHNPPGQGNGYPTAVAETRADSRAFRFLLGLDFCSWDEIGKIGNSNINPNGNSNNIGTTQKQVIETKFFGEKNKKIKDVISIVGRNINKLDDLTYDEARTVIMEFNKK